jgi:hypothetical protein
MIRLYDGLFPNISICCHNFLPILHLLSYLYVLRRKGKLDVLVKKNTSQACTKGSITHSPHGEWHNFGRASPLQAGLF